MGSIAALLKLFETKYPLFVLCLGSSFCVLAALGEEIPIGEAVISIEQKYDSTFIQVGISLVITALVLFLIGIFVQKEKSETEEKSTTTQFNFNAEILLQQRQKILDLSNALSKVNELTAGSEDEISQEVQRIMNDVHRTLLEIRNRPEHTDRLVRWIHNHKKDWMKNIPTSLYRKSIRGRRNKKLFLSELEAHINLLAENICGGRYGSPRKTGITRHLEDSTPYIVGMIEIKKLATADLDRESSNLLGERERTIFFRYLQKLIKDM